MGPGSRTRSAALPQLGFELGEAGGEGVAFRADLVGARDDLARGPIPNLQAHRIVDPELKPEGLGVETPAGPGSTRW